MTEPATPAPATARSDGAERRRSPRESAGASSFVPMLLVALAVVAWLAFQAVERVRDRQQLSLVQASLLPQEQAARKLRASLDAVATATARLAADGNANAGAIVEELRRRGVTIRPPGAAQPN